MRTRQLHRTWLSFLIAFVMAVLLIYGITLPALADGEVRQATSFLDYATATSGDVDNATFLVDKDTGEVNDMESFEEVFGQEYPENDAKARGIVEEDGDFIVTNVDDDTIYVSSTFGCKRLLVQATLTSLYGAEEGVTYDGETILQFATEEATKAAYHQLVEEYGEENVMPDFVV